MEREKQYRWEIDLDNIPAQKMVDKKMLFCDLSYQRELNENKVLEICRDFSWEKFGSISVMQRGGRYYITDGQHRHAAALKISAVQKLPCTICQSKSEAEEAASFLGQNTLRKAVSSGDKFRAGVVAENEDDLAVKEMLDALELRVAKNTAASKSGNMQFITEIKRTFARSPEKTKQALLLQMMIVDEKEPLSCYVHKGLFLVLEKSEYTIREEDVEKIKKSGGNVALLAAINKLSIVSGVGRGEKICALGVLEVLNKFRRNKITLKKNEEAD